MLLIASNAHTTISAVNVPVDMFYLDMELVFPQYVISKTVNPAALTISVRHVT